MRSANPLRQKMINMMYLLLIALAFLNNVVDDIEAFTDLNRTLENANLKLDQRNLRTIATIETFKNLDSLQYADIYGKVVDARRIADTTVYFLENIKADLIKKTGGMSKFNHLKKAGNPDLPDRYVYKTGMGNNIKAKLEYTKKELLAILGNSADAHMLDTVLRLDNKLPKISGTYYNWDRYYFSNVPLNAAIATLTKFQNDVRVAESMVINHFNDDIQNGNTGKGNYNFDFVADAETKLDTIYLAKGVKKHDVFNVGEDGVTTITLPVNKRDQSQNAVIYVYDDKGQVKDSFQFNNGVGEIKLPTDQMGEFKIKGVVKFRYPDKAKPISANEQKDNKTLENKKKDDEHPFEVKYKVTGAKPYISQKDYKTLYIGINNPLNIYHPEHGAKDYKVSITQGKLVRVDSSFYAIPSREGFANVVLEVPTSDGKGYTKVAEETFKVRELPKPSVTIYNKEGGSMPSKIFKQQKGMVATGKELPIEMNFRVIDFQVTYVNANGLGIFKENVKGSYFTGKSRELIDLAQPGDIFIFDNIHVKGPDGVNKNVDALVFTIL